MVTIYFDWNSRDEPKSNLVQQPKSILQKHKPKIMEEVPFVDVSENNHKGNLTYHQQYYFVIILI